MLVYMVRGLATSNKYVVASYGVSTLTSRYMYDKTWDVIGELEMANAWILGLVCDGCGANRTFINMHTPRSHDSDVVYDTMNLFADRVFYFFSDVSHLLKTLRNNFYSSGHGPRHTRRLIKNGQDIVWKTIVDLYDSEKNNIVRTAYKLNKKCVELTQKGKMKVCYAAYVFSDTVDKALGEFNDPSIEETRIFIRKVNEFFDCLNGCHSQQGKRKCNANLDAYTFEDDPRFDKLRGFVEYLQDWKNDIRVIVQRLKVSNEDQNKCLLSEDTQIGVEMTVRSFIAATQFMLRHGAKYINARVFCQDPLEQYFSKQRSHVGGSTNPNEKQFYSTECNLRYVREHVPFRKSGNTTEYLEEKREAINAPLKRLQRAPPKKKPARRSLAYSNAEANTRATEGLLLAIKNVPEPSLK
ncbi:hypothetical protein ONE63_003404 [Megalurothrips usitatus]|uniref:Transposable element P transposase-like GTP-binding insertion domain-containing protein n=1 Tax=Megalurothrips usitatus TaxID=439358 RepID=A0AAV7X770_9NEOP|nr:hypothetical protein ONE63_003404 [Megalurothrips usitatus]